METSLMVYDYPEPPEENDETNITIQLEIRTTDIFPETWDKEHIRNYIEENIKDYLRDDDITIHEIEV